jgi:hypothetical protein
VNDGDTLRECASYTVDGGELTDAKGGDESRYLLDAGITIGGIG